MAARKKVTRRRRPNPFARRRHTRRRSNPARSNPGHGIGGIVMGGVWVGAGMYLGGIVGGFLTPITGGIIGSLPFGGVLQGLVNAYVVQMIAGRFTHNAGLMAAGAFAGTAMGAISGVLGGAGSLVSSVTGGITGAVQTPKQSGATGAVTAGSGGGNVIQMPVSANAGN